MGLFGIPCLTPRESRGRPKGRLLRVVGFEVQVAVDRGALRAGNIVIVHKTLHDIQQGLTHAVQDSHGVLPPIAKRIDQ